MTTLESKVSSSEDRGRLYDIEYRNRAGFRFRHFESMKIIPTCHNHLNIGIHDERMYHPVKIGGCCLGPSPSTWRRSDSSGSGSRGRHTVL